MKKLFKLVSLAWILSPFAYVALRLANLVNVEHENVTIALVLCGISYVALFLNIE